MARNETDPKIRRPQPAESMNPVTDNDGRPWFASDDDAPDGDAPDGGPSKQRDKRYSKPGPLTDGSASSRK